MRVFPCHPCGPHSQPCPCAQVCLKVPIPAVPSLHPRYLLFRLWASLTSSSFYPVHISVLRLLCVSSPLLFSPSQHPPHLAFGVWRAEKCQKCVAQLGPREEKGSISSKSQRAAHTGPRALDLSLQDRCTRRHRETVTHSFTRCLMQSPSC